MLPPSNIQNSAGTTSNPRTTQELANALTVGKAAQVTIKQVSVSPLSGNNPNQPATASLVIQLGGQQYQLKIQQQPGESLTAQTQAILTRTADGKILLDFLQQPLTPGKTAPPSEQTVKTNASATSADQTVRNNTPAAPQAKTTSQTAVNPHQTLSTGTQRNSPIQVNLGQPQPAALTINRPISGQTIQVIPQAPPAAAPLQTGTALASVTTQPAGHTPHSIQSNTAQPPAAQSGITNAQPAESQANNRPLQKSSTPSGAVPTNSAPVSQSPINQNSQRTAQATVTANQSSPTASSSAQTVQLLAQPSAALSKELPLQRPVLVNIEQSTLQTNGSQTIQVKLGDQSLQLRSPIPLSINDKAVLLRTSGTQAVLQPISPDIQSKENQKIISETLREVLPNQQPLANVLNQLQQIGKQNNKPENSNLNRLLSSLMSLYSVPSEGGKEASQSVQRNVQDGGLFSERQLLNNKPPAQDLKAQLGQLLNAADSLPEQPRQQMLDLIKSLLNRVTQNQLESLQQNRTNPDGSLERLFTLDLPVRQGQQLDNVELKINEYRREVNDQEWQSSWKVRLHFNLEQQGTVDAEILLEQENEVTAQFWCSHSSTTNLLNEKLNGFNQHLQDQGFVINNLNCHTGKTPTAKNQVQQLIDINT